MPLLIDARLINVIPKVQTPFKLPVTKCEKPNYMTSNGTSSTPSSTPPDTPSPDKIDNRDPTAFPFDTEDDMRLEDARLKSFENWPVSFLPPQKLAQNGFYYLGRGDEVRCAFCKVEIMRWMEGDDPAKDHQRWAPQCPLLKKQATSGNMPPSATLNGRDECGTRAPATLPGGRPNPAHPQYSNFAARLRTYKDWPRSMPQKPDDLAEAGFYYTGQGDKTKCFHCDGGLKDWEKDDDPWEEHARWFDRCYYVNFIKGREYVQKVLTSSSFIAEPKATEASTSTPTTASTSASGDENNLDDSSKLCKICYVDERNIVFLPCGHVCACAKCAVSTIDCPMCRRPIENAIKVYFS